MLGYRHSFHAGNFADVLKHMVLVRILRYLTQQDTPLLYIDTHAGAGAYNLTTPKAGKAMQFENGIGRLWSRTDLPVPVADYVTQVRLLNGNNQLLRYPGSPWLARQLLRSTDRMALYDMHPLEVMLLRENCRGDRRCRIQREDGFKACQALLPPSEQHAIVLIDPPYELKEDYHRIVDTVVDAHCRFASGTYIIWYPVVDRHRVDRLEMTLASSGIRKILLLELGTATDRTGLGMTASGVIVINPPWSLDTEIAPTLDYLAAILGKQGRGHFRVEQLVDD